MATGANAEFAGTGNEPIDPAAITASSGGGSAAGTGGDDFDPAIHAGRDKRNADGTYTRKRGRRASGSGTSSGSAAKAGPVNLAGIESVLVSIHAILAAATETPEMALDQREAKAMTEAIAEVQRHYPMTIDPKMMAWVNLATVSATIYGPRVYLIRARKIEEAKKAKSNADPLVAYGAAAKPN